MSDETSTRHWLGSPTGPLFNVYAMVAAFATYFCMYAFRKPFSAGSFDGEAPLLLPLLHVELRYKTVLIISQVLGYTLSKFIGIKVISEVKAGQRALGIVGLIAAAEVALLGFALAPRPFDALFLFANGIPLGMVWGLVFAYLEGRRTTELLGAGLSVSFIVSSGAVKAVGRGLVELGLTEHWMPFVTGALFAIPLVVSVFLLSKIPPPTDRDEAERTHRQPMHKAERRAFLKRYWPGIVLVVGFYMLLTAYRDFRDNFAREIWDAVGREGESLIFAASEVPVGIVAGLIMAAIVLIRSNRKAVVAVHAMMVFGSAAVGIATLLYQAGAIGPVAWMVAIGTGLYVAYIPIASILFDRVLAETHFVGTAGFMIYVADAFGYVGSVGVMLYKDIGSPQMKWLEFFIPFSYLASAGCTGAFVMSAAYFWKKGLDDSGERPAPVAG